MQIILGASGAIGKDLAKELKEYTDKVRLMSRHPLKIKKKCSNRSPEMPDYELKI